MAKTTRTYWNPVLPENHAAWAPVEGFEGIAEEVTLAVDTVTGDYTRLTRFLPGADTTSLGGKAHDYPEEIFVVEGSLYDVAFERWLTAGDYASRPPGEIHGPFRTEEGCLVLEMSFPGSNVTR
jgi:hypothetical protein